MTRIQHILDKNAVARGGIVYENVGECADDLAVLNDGRAGQECGQQRTTLFNEKLTKIRRE